MAGRILTQFKQKVSALELVPAGGGCFEIERDGAMIFSKLSTGAFPEEDAILQQLE